MDQSIGRAELINVHPRYCIRQGLYRSNLHSSKIFGVPGHHADMTFSSSLQIMPGLPTMDPVITGIPACNWTNGLGPTNKLLATATPQIQNTPLRGLPDIHHQQQHHFVPTTDGFVHGHIAKDGTFGIVNDPKLGPVEKAVLHQAMYNQSKKLTPEMRRCDDCNVIFNSQNQAEMHYKGKKHAKVMFLKRNREVKRSSTKSAYTASGVDLQESARLSSDAVRLTTNDLMPNEIGPKFEQGYETDSSLDHNLSASDHFPQESHKMEILTPKSDDQVIPYQSAITNVTNQSEIVVNERAISEERNSSQLEDDCNNQKDDDSKTEACATITPREPVILPDPLPRYISRIEKPTVLKESLRCTVCDIYVNSENQMRQHVNSLRHKNIEKGIPTPPKPVKEDKPKGRSEQFRCEVCRVTLNSDIQLLQHLSSQRHRNMLDGKPPKPRWTPYERTQHALLRSAAHLRFSALKTIPNGGSPILLSPTISATPSQLPLPSHAALGSSVIAQAPTPTHLKQMAYITPNGGILQAQEIVYIGAAPPSFASHHQPQPTHQIPTTAATLMQSPIPGIPHQDLSFLTAPCVSLDQRDLGFNWNPGI